MSALMASGLGANGLGASGLGASGLGWQDAVVALLAAGAFAWLVRSKLRARRSAAVCSNCPGCEALAAAPPAEDAAQGTLVALKMSPRARKA